jgi:hypothetical protein
VRPNAVRFSEAFHRTVLHNVAPMERPVSALRQKQTSCGSRLLDTWLTSVFSRTPALRPVTDFHCPSFSITLRQSDDAGRQIKVRRFGRFQVDDKFERGRLLDRYFGNRRAAQILIICRLTCVRQMPTMRVPYAASPPASIISKSEPGAREGDRSSAFCQTANKL